MWILPLLGYLGLILGFFFLTLAIASGLYYLSELVEEHTVLSKRILQRLIYSITILFVLLALVDGLPWHYTVLSVASHAVYYQNLARFPIVKLTSPVFLLSCGLVLVNHWVWFRYFSEPTSRGARGGSSAGGGRGGGGSSRYDWEYHARQHYPTFTEVASFFGLMVWSVPFALFVSLSAGEMVLPSMGSEYATGVGSSFVSPGIEPSGMTHPNMQFGGDGMGINTGMGGMGGIGGGGGGNMGQERSRHRRRNTQTGMAKAAVNGVKEWIGETGEVMGLWRGERTRPL